jgi:hypothetical protein
MLLLAPRSGRARSRIARVLPVRARAAALASPPSRCPLTLAHGGFVEHVAAPGAGPSIVEQPQGRQCEESAQRKLTGSRMCRPREWGSGREVQVRAT